MNDDEDYVFIVNVCGFTTVKFISNTILQSSLLPFILVEFLTVQEPVMILFILYIST